MPNPCIPISWLFPQNRKGVRRRVAIESIERFENRDLPSASPLLLDVPKWVDLPDQNPAEVSSAARNKDDSRRHGSEVRTTNRWDKVLLGDWYVPAANLLAYGVSPDPLVLVPIADQTVFHITSVKNGVFSGENTVTFSKPTFVGLETGDTATYSMTGFVTRQGEVRIVFSSLETGQPLVTGIGEMQFVKRSWRITMQMSTGVSPYLTHWAYMSKLQAGETPPVAELPVENGALHNGKFRRLEGTRWTLTDSELFAPPAGDVQVQPGVDFQIDGYRNGYFWGTSPSDESTGLTVVGSVTPRGNLFLVLTTEDGTTVTRAGILKRDARGRWTMYFRAYELTPAVGVAWNID